MPLTEFARRAFCTRNATVGAEVGFQVSRMMFDCWNALQTTFNGLAQAVLAQRLHIPWNNNFEFKHRRAHLLVMSEN